MNFKNLIIVLLLSPITSLAQYQNGFLQEYFFGRQNSAQSEALGKSLVSLDGNASSMHFNPAGLSGLKGIESSTSFATPFYSHKEARYQTLNIASRVNPKLCLGIALNQIDLEFPITATNQSGMPIVTHPYNMVNGKISASYSPVETFHIGGSFNYFSWIPEYLQGKSLYMDFGVLKKFRFSRFQNNQSINLATTITNFTGSSLKYSAPIHNTEITATLPIISKSGITYYFHSNPKDQERLNFFKLLTTVEYQDILNFQYISQISGGAEITFYEIVSLRGGYYQTTNYDYNFSSNKDKIESLTYGFGVNLPFDKLTKLPMTLSIDYTQLPQPAYHVGGSWEDFKSLNVAMSYKFKNQN